MVNEISRDQAAYHEAGHAVAAYLVRRPLIRVSIIREGESLGHTAYRQWRDGFDPDRGLTARDRRSFEAAIVASLSGVEAQKRYAGELPTGDPSAADDLYNAFQLARYLVDSAEEHRAFIAWLQVRAADLIRRPGHWAAVRAVAEALLERGVLSGPKTRQIIRDSIRAHPTYRQVRHRPKVLSLPDGTLKVLDRP